MQYLLQDLIKLPFSDRLYIIEKVLGTLVSDDMALQELIHRAQQNFFIDDSIEAKNAI